MHIQKIYSDPNGYATHLVANKILDMVRNGYKIYDKKMKADRPIQFKDIVLLTPTKKNNIDIQDIFKQLKMPTAVNDTQNYFQTTEIAIMMSRSGMMC